ncbi:Rrf2 family transcriptional regulator [Skermanella rosea]|mgnify:FL=1|uniref:Rrf2 family transcriptional regulator n=1 Tax=Skermanella cutis TaxID=2775420 RepID=A0ABX7B4S5_9PROT|nr:MULTISPECIES: Rrf2 family transcriptional regulator [Skermanella]QQP89134.1 Rrf2 family transcriptional regulator [Skermanella sp. TT6]UEM03112.1 Rrf2 family transcriptional regulator [Skermanella rosea]
MLSQKAKYALQALLVLAELDEGESLMIGDIAERQRLPKRFLEQILLDLKHQGVVQSWRGKNGGYALLKPADKISFGEIVRIIDGPLAPLPCLSRMAYRRCEECVDEERCAVRRVFAKVHDATTEILDGMTLARALGGTGEVRELLRSAG